MAEMKAVLLTQKKNKQGEAPLVIRITKNRRSKFIRINKLSIQPEKWDNESGTVKKSHPDANKLNAIISRELAKARSLSLDLDLSSRITSAEEIKKHVVGKGKNNFLLYADQYIADLKAKGKIGTYVKASATISKLKTYVGEESLFFEDINFDFLKNYDQYLRIKLSNKTNTVQSNMKILRMLFTRSINEGIIQLEKNPFLRFKLSTEQVEKVYLTEEELKIVEDLNLPVNSMRNHHRNLFIFCCYAGGLRISDALQIKWRNFDGKRIVIGMTQKTKSPASIILVPKALQILLSYKADDSTPDKFIFPLLNSKNDLSDPMVLSKSISSATAYTNKNLKKIGELCELNKSINFHCSRHTFATLALSRGLRLEYVSKMLAHKSIKTTQIYAKIITADLDAAMLKAFNNETKKS